MSSHADLVRVHTNVEIDPKMIHAAKSECDEFDLSTTASFKVFQPGKKCGTIIEAVKQQVRLQSPQSRCYARSLITELAQGPSA